MTADRPSSNRAPLGDSEQPAVDVTSAAAPELDAATRAELEARLDALERASDERRAQLTELAALVPAAVSRRAMLRSVASDLRHAPGKRDIVARAGQKLGRGAAGVRRRVAPRTSGE